MFQNQDSFNLDGQAFAGLVEAVNSSIEDTVSTMITKDNSEATITAKIKICLEKMQTLNGEDGIYPVVNFDVTSAIQARSKTSGKIEQVIELTYDKDSCKYVANYPISNQTTLFDGDGLDESEDGEYDYDSDDMEE